MSVQVFSEAIASGRRVRFVWVGRELPDADTVGECRLGEGDVIMVAIGPPGSAEAPGSAPPSARPPTAVDAAASMDRVVEDLTEHCSVVRLAFGVLLVLWVWRMAAPEFFSTAGTVALSGMTVGVLAASSACFSRWPDVFTWSAVPSRRGS
jgi:hypothetical protein